MREAQSLGLKVLAWTVNDRQSMGQMLDLGVDGLVTDRPDIAADLLKERSIGRSKAFQRETRPVFYLSSLAIRR